MTQAHRKTSPRIAFCILLALAATPLQVFAQAPVDEAETTIRLMGVAEAEVPEAVTRQIELPPAAREETGAVERAARALERANENRARMDEGLSRADEARERGAEMSDEARENVENRSRADENRPAAPGRPDTPEPQDR